MKSQNPREAAWSRSRYGQGTPPEVVVLDAQYRQSLAAVRSLGRSGISVGAVACRSDADWAPALRSRLCGFEAVVPDFKDDADGYATAIADLLDQYPVRMVLPSHDGS